MESATNIHWNNRAKIVKDDISVNIADIYQRNLEYNIICPYLRKESRVLEVGCGNGYSTSIFRELVGHINAFDFSKNMIDRAVCTFGQTNNSFFVDNILDPKHLSGLYDSIICVRVLINLRDLSEQKKAIANMCSLLNKGGLLLLVEGFMDGFIALNEIRNKVGMPPLQPAKINFYSSIGDLKPYLEESFEIKDEFHLGSYDFLTRFIYPQMVGFENVKHNTEYHEKFQRLAGDYNPDFFKELSRIRIFVMTKK